MGADSFKSREETDRRADEICSQIRQRDAYYNREISCQPPPWVKGPYGGQFEGEFTAPLLEAIFCEKLNGNITSSDAMSLVKEWLDKTTKDEIGANAYSLYDNTVMFQIYEIRHLKEKNLATAEEIDKILKLLKIPSSGQKRGIQEYLMENFGYTLSPEQASSLPGFVQRHVKKILAGTGLAVAAAYGIATTNPLNSSEDGPTPLPQAPPAATASPTPEPVLPAPAPVVPEATPLETPPTSPPPSEQETPMPIQPAPILEPPAPVEVPVEAPAEAPIEAPVDEPAIIPALPAAPPAPAPQLTPETIPETPKTENFPLVTRQNALGATFIDVEASRPAWEKDGWKVEPFVNQNGTKAVRLSKNGKIATIHNLRISPETSVLSLNLE